MPAVFVHGVPDTPAVWDSVIARLSREDVAAVQLPGFGCARPDGFPATKEAYIEWLLAELQRLAPGEPIDLVGHDWGSLLVTRVASLRPDHLRSWVAGNGPIDRSYVWHEMAQLWQTPEVGEQAMDAMTPETLAEGLMAIGLTEETAHRTAERVDDVMKSCILDLYRSAVDVGAEWENDLRRIDTPGLVLWGANDPFVAPVHGEHMAAQAGAKFQTLDTSHWWPIEAPGAVADALEAFWSDV